VRDGGLQNVYPAIAERPSFLLKVENERLAQISINIFLGRVYRVRNSAATAFSFGGGRLVLEKDDTRKQILTQ